MAIASAICTAMIGFGLFARRGDRSRRWLFVVAGFLCSAMTAVTIVVSAGGYPRDFSPILGFIGGTAVLVPASAMIFFGWKGRRIGDHPHCRHCGFDLFGKPPESTRCSECGTDVANPKSVVVGIHQVRRRWVLAGLFSLILGLMMAGEAGHEYAIHADLYRLLPTWWLLWDLDSPATHNRAEGALQNKLYSGGLTHGQAEQIAQRALKNLEAGRSEYLLRPLIAFIDQREVLDESTVRRLMRQVARLTSIRTQPLAVRGRPILFFDNFLTARPNSNGSANQSSNLTRLDWNIKSSVFRVGQFLVPAGEVMAAPASVEQEPDWDGSAIDLADDWPKIPSGGITISRDLTLAVTMNYRGKLLEETSKATCQSTARVVTAHEGAVPLVQPNQDETAATWSATVFMGGTRPGIKITRLSNSWSRVFARAAIIDSRGRHEIGIAVVDNDTGMIRLFAPLDIPQEHFRIELVPAPLDAAGGWNNSAILNQIIQITDISRSPNAMP
jgi:hypothetical protein